MKEGREVNDEKVGKHNEQQRRGQVSLHSNHYDSMREMLEGAESYQRAIGSEEMESSVDEEEEENHLDEDGAPAVVNRRIIRT